MSLQEDLQKAYQEQDWNIIKYMYKQWFGIELTEVQQTLTHLAVPPPKKRGRRKKQAAEVTVIAPPQETVSPSQSKNDIQQFTTSIIQEGSSTTQNDGNNKKQCRTEQIKPSRQNMWNDTFTEAQEDLKENNPQLNKLYNKTRSTRSRPKASNQLVSVVCSICHKKEKVDPIFAITYNANPDNNTYKCNDCLSHQR